MTRDGAYRLHWVVEISQDDDSPEVYGPYSQADAERIAESFNRAAERRWNRPHEAGTVGWLHASAWPLRRENITGLRKEYDI
jgi:hypothetical protein